MKTFRAAVSILGLLLLLTSFAYGAPSGKKVTIAATWTDLSNEWAAKMEIAAKAEAQKLGVNFIEADSRFETSQQIAEAENFITQKVDVIILHPDDTAGSAPVIDLAKKAGTPVVLVNSLTSNASEALCYVGSDDITAGELEAGYMAKALKGKGNIVIMDGPMGTSPQINREIGYKHILDKYPGIKILSDQPANWDRSKALALAENWLTSGLPINGILCENDEMALGAAAAVKESGKTNIIVAGIDAIPDAVKAVANGTLAATVFQDAVGQGVNAVDVAYKIATGQTVPKRVIIPFVLVTKENVDQYVGK